MEESWTNHDTNRQREGDHEADCVLPLRCHSDVAGPEPFIAQQLHTETDVLEGVERVRLAENPVLWHALSAKPLPHQDRCRHRLNFGRVEDTAREQEPVVLAPLPQLEAAFAAIERVAGGELIERKDPAARHEQDAGTARGHC